MDLDGASEFSPVVELNIVGGHALELTSATPNPFGAQSSLMMSVGKSQHVRVALHDMLGRQLALLHDGAVDGSVTVSVDGSSLPAGIYVIRAQGETTSASQVLTRVR